GWSWLRATRLIGVKQGLMSFSMTDSESPEAPGATNDFGRIPTISLPWTRCRIFSSVMHSIAACGRSAPADMKRLSTKFLIGVPDVGRIHVARASVRQSTDGCRLNG